MSDAEARFRAFLKSTQQREREWTAFREFEEAVRRAAERAAVVNPSDDPARHVREISVLKASVGKMLLRALPRFGLGPILAKAEGIGHTIRFAFISPSKGLDGVADAGALDALVQKGEAAFLAHMDESSERLWKDRRGKERRKREKQGL